MKVAIVQKAPSKTDYERHFKVPIAEVFNLSSKPVSRLLKKDVDLVDFDPHKFDYVILIGSEAAKHFTKVTAVTNYTGRLVGPELSKSDYPNFIISISPAVLAFKPENRPVFEATVADIHKILKGLGPSTVEKDYQYFEAHQSKEANDYIRSVIRSKYSIIALDSETSSLEPREGYPIGISISHKVDQGVYIHGDAVDEITIMLLQELIDKKDVVLHNAKFDLKYFAYHYGIKFDHREGHIHDTMILHYLLDERTGTHGLKPLAMKYTNLGDYDRELDEWKDNYCKTHGINKEFFTYDLIPWDIIKLYAVKDTDATLQLFNKFYPFIEKNENLHRCYYELQLPVLHLLTNMEDVGVNVSRNRLEQANILLDNKLAKLKKELWSYDAIKALEEEQHAVFNPNSVPQLRKLLFDYLKLPVPDKRTTTGAISTDTSVLQDLAKIHKVPDLVYQIRKTTKLKNTYINKLLPVINDDGRVRTGFHQVTTTSGRLSSSGRFNMQQLPRDEPLIKGCVIAPPGYKIVALDLTTAEIYYAAVLSGDKELQSVFINMQRNPEMYSDFHSTIAFMVFQLKCDPKDVKKLYPALRQAAKAISFGINV